MKIRATNVTRVGGIISQIVKKQYNEEGSLLETETKSISRTGGLIDELTRVLT